MRQALIGREPDGRGRKRRLADDATVSGGAAAAHAAAAEPGDDTAGSRSTRQRHEGGGSAAAHSSTADSSGSAQDHSDGGQHDAMYRAATPHAGQRAGRQEQTAEAAEQSERQLQCQLQRQPAAATASNGKQLDASAANDGGEPHAGRTARRTRGNDGSGGSGDGTRSTAMCAHSSMEATNGTGAAQHSESGGAKNGSGVPPAAENADGESGDAVVAATAAPAARAANDAAFSAAASDAGGSRSEPADGGADETVNRHPGVGEKRRRYDETKRRGPRKAPSVGYMTSSGGRAGHMHAAATVVMGPAALERVVAGRYEWRDRAMPSVRGKRKRFWDAMAGLPVRAQRHG